MKPFVFVLIADCWRNSRRTAINVVELSVTDGKLLTDNPDKPTFIDLKSAREEEK
jgi:hypothetical protein